MYELTDRERQIVFYLYSKPNSPASTIAAIFNVSDKTIRNDIKSINNLFNKQLIISTKMGFSINKEFEDLISMIPLTRTEFDDDNELIFYLLQYGTSNIFSLADKLSVSESTLITHINNLKSFFSKYDLSILRANNDISLIGEGFKKRQLYIDRIIDEAGSTFNDVVTFQKFFNNINLTEISEYVIDLLDKHNYKITSFYLNNLLLNLFVILNFDFEDENRNSSCDKELFGLANQINRNLNNSKIDKTNSIYNSLRSVINGGDNDISNIEQSIKNITNEIFKKYSLDINMESFFPVFVRHIYDMIIRCKNNNPVRSDGGLSIKESCFFIYDIAVSIATEIQNLYNITINPQEISLISMHIGFLIENSVEKDSHEKIKIGINTGNYVNQQSLMNKLKKLIHYNSEIEVIQKKELLNTKGYDLIVSTSFAEKTNVKNCIITPLFTKSDEIKILNAANGIIKQKRKSLLKALFNVYIHPDNFYYDNKHTDRDIVIRKLCNNLESKNLVDSNFLPSVLVREAIASTDICDMYAIPHAMEFIANETSMCIYINPKGISWGENEVKIVFLSAINRNNVKNLRLLYDLIVETVSDMDCFSKLIQCKTINQFYSVLFSD